MKNGKYYVVYRQRKENLQDVDILRGFSTLDKAVIYLSYQKLQDDYSDYEYSMGECLLSEE
jgi:hypothetical protein